MAKSVAYTIPAEVSPQKAHWAITSPIMLAADSILKAKPNELSREDLEIVAALNDATEDMAFIHSCFDHITEEILVDCLIYELKAASLRHKYYLDLCKEKGIIASS